MTSFQKKDFVNKFVLLYLINLIINSVQFKRYFKKYHKNYELIFKSTYSIYALLIFIMKNFEIYLIGLLIFFTVIFLKPDINFHI